MNYRFFIRFVWLCVIGIKAAFAQQLPVLFKSGPYLATTTIEEYTVAPEKWASQIINHQWYGIFQFNALPSAEQKEKLKQNGVSIIGYIPNNAYVVIVPENFDPAIAKEVMVSRMFQPEAKHKMNPAFYEGEIPEWAQSTATTIDMNVELFENIQAEKFLEQINNQTISIISSEPAFHKITLRLPAANRMDIAALPNVLWVEPVPPKIAAENIPGKSLHRSNVLNDGVRKLTGKDVKIGIWDGGVVGPHIDFMNRLTVVETGISDDHATHVCGTMAGAGNIDPKARGMAPKAEIFGYNFNGSVNTEIGNSISVNQIVISQHSYGFGNAFVNCTTKDPYQLNSREQDINVANNPYFLHAHSAGNSQGVCTGGWGTTTGKAAKNILVVANISSTETINSSSSFGPVNDGRLKPEISAVGVDVYSTLPNNSYVGGYTGTSMATPVVSGVSAQLYERYRQLNANANPPASLLKAIICNTAKDVGTAGPDYKFGYGVLNGLKAVKTLEENNYAVNLVSQATYGIHNITIPPGATKVKVTISWTDVPALANANPALVNDLDLVLRDQNSVATLPWVLNAAAPANAATRAADHLNNTEQVTLDNPAAGNYTIEVYGFSVPMGVQEYAVAWEIETPYMTLTYPDGNEHLVPGTTAVVHWDNAGVTGTQTLQYSTNGGGSWTNISTSIASTAKQFAWSIPSTLNGTKVLLKISGGIYSDVSDSAFSIINTPGTITFGSGCATGEIKLSWAAVTGATHYDIVCLNSTTGDWDTLVHAGNVTSANVTGLTPAQLYWFSVIARNNTTGAIGERSLASSYTIPSTVIPPPILINAVSQSIPVACSGANLSLTASTQVTKAPFASYVFATGTSAALEPMSGSTTVIGPNVDDALSAAIPIGFSFNLDQINYTTLTVSPDGWVKMGVSTTTENTNSVVATFNIPKIYPFWDNLATGLDGNVQTMLTGTAPNQIFVIQWLVTIPRNLTGNANSIFQLLLHEKTNKIEFRYGTMGTAPSASVGVTISSAVYKCINVTTNIHMSNMAYNANTTPPTIGRYYSFSLPEAPAITWSPATFLTSTSGATVNVSNFTASTNYKVTATDALGCSTSSQYMLYVNPKPKPGFTVNNTVQPRNTNSFLFTDTATNAGVTRTWNFGDGNTGTTNPATKSYVSTGTYNVKLKLTTPVGCSDSLTKAVTVTTSTPTQFASSLQFSEISGTSMRLTWTNGNGQQRVVIAKAGTAVSTTLTDNVSYPANPQFGSGALLADGSFVVYQGTSNTTVITGLSILTNYYFAIVEMSIDNGVNMYQPAPYLTGSNSTLPVNWLSFEAVLKGNNAVELSWSTASEQNNDRFVIERSEDLRNWKTIGSLKGKGNTHMVSNYGFTDEPVDFSSGTIYYRIKQIDFNGTYAYSTVRSVNFSKPLETIVLYPNPTANHIYIRHLSENGVDIMIQNLSGKVIYTKQHYRSEELIDLQDLSGGFYTIQLYENGSLVFTEKLIIQP